MSIEPFCRCGRERIVAGKAITCPHCDQPCPEKPADCLRCVQLARTCNDCRAIHFTTKSARICEETHW